jgi:zinc protease
VTEIFKEIRLIRETPLSGTELSLAKDSLVRSLPSQFETSARVTSSTASIFLYDLGLDYYAKLPARLTAVTADQVMAVANRYLVPEKMLVVAVGDSARIRQPLGSLKLGAVELRNADGALIK